MADPVLRFETHFYCAFPHALVMYHVFSEYKVHSHNRNGLCAVAFMDDHYPVRSAFSLLNKVPTIIPEIPLMSLHSA